MDVRLRDAEEGGIVWEGWSGSRRFCGVDAAEGRQRASGIAPGVDASRGDVSEALRGGCAEDARGSVALARDAAGTCF